MNVRPGDRLVLESGGGGGWGDPGQRDTGAIVEDIENGFTLRDDGEIVAEVVFGESGTVWPDEARAAYIVHLAGRSAGLFEAVANEARARGLRRVRARCEVADSATREFFASAGLRFRGIRGKVLDHRTYSASLLPPAGKPSSQISSTGNS